jgi:hypothetical protein
MHAAITTHRRGISLLEVLISIGILSIGLLASLALIPAGRTYMKKAAVDDRAAALVPNAYATMKTLGIFSERSLVWSGATNAPLLYPEPDLVIREQTGTDVFTTPSSNGSTLDGGWTIETIDDEQITAFHPQNLPPTTITGSVPPIPAASGTTPRAASYVVTVTCSTTWQVDGMNKTGTSNPYHGPNGTPTADPDTGRWTFSITPRPLNAPDMAIFTSGSNVGQPSNSSGPNSTGSNSSVLYTFGATYVDTTGTTTPSPILNANPSLTTFRQYGRLRAIDHRFGKAKTTYTKPSNATDGNHDSSSAMNISLTPLENAVSQKTGQLASFVEKTVKGTLWRMQIGTRRGRYDQDVDFDNADGAPPRPRAPVFPKNDITRNVGDTWLDGSGNPQAGPDDTPEDIDWYKFDVEAGNVLEITWRDDDGVLLPDGDAISQSYKFPMYFKENDTPMHALSRSGNIDTYTIPQDGYVKTRVQLLPSSGSDSDIPVLLNTFGREGDVRNSRRNPHYEFKIKLSRSDRVVVIDPLLATRLDKIIALNRGAGRFDPYYLRRHRFADFQQFFTGSGSPRAFIIPRLNWQPYGSADVDVRLAMADKLFRDQDNIATDQPTNEDDAPTPLFDLSSLASPVRRQAEGRMSWLLMLQPEDPGSVQSNWHAGRYFNVSMVIFEDRMLPAPVSGAALDGEYALFGNWSELDGQITVNVPTSGPNATATANLDEEDVRQLFKAGAYVLVAPRTIYEGSLLDSTQQLDWVRIQTSQIQRNADGNGFLVTLMPDHEPKVLNGSASNALVVAAYQGVVSVVSKSMRLDE